MSSSAAPPPAIHQNVPPSSTSASTQEAIRVAWRNLFNWQQANRPAVPRSRPTYPLDTPTGMIPFITTAFIAGQTTYGNPAGIIAPPIPANQDTPECDSSMWEYYHQGYDWARYQDQEARNRRPATSSVSVRAPKVSNPEPFFGDQEKFQDFVQQLHLVFNSDPTRYLGTQAKLSYAASYLRGAAKKWFTPHVDEITGVISFATFEIFIVALKATFDDPDPDATAQRKLRELTQGSDTAATYHSKFITVLGKLNVTDTSRIAAFRHGLNEPIKDLLVGKQVPDVFDEFVQFCIRLDNDFRARQKEKKFSSSNSSFRPVHPSDRMNLSRSNKPPSQFFKNRTFGAASHFPPMTQNPSTATGTHSGPMDLSAGRRGPLTDSEKAHRHANNLCLYCGKPGHFASDCRHPSRKKDNNKSKPKAYGAANAFASSSSPSASGNSISLLYSSEAKN